MSSSASRTPSSGVGGVLLVGPPVPDQRGVHRLPERAVERRGVLRGVGEDRDVLGADAVERGADHPHLAVHHPAGPDHVDAGSGVRARHLGVQLEGGVVVDPAGGVEDAAVAVVGELVEAEVAHHGDRVTDLGLHVGDRDVEDAVGVERAGAGGVLGLGDAEQHHPAQTGGGRLGGGLPQRVAGVLDDAGHRRDRLRLGEALADEHRQHQLARLQGGLGDHPAQRGGTPEPAGPDRRDVHALILSRMRQDVIRDGRPGDHSA